MQNQDVTAFLELEGYIFEIFRTLYACASRRGKLEIFKRIEIIFHDLKNASGCRQEMVNFHALRIAVSS
jgi:hypothetical protein